jgi:hypothetical protein
VTSSVAETRLTQELVSCPVLVEQPSTQIVLGTAWLDKAPTLGNRATHAAMLEICDGLLLELGRRSGVAGRVREVLLEDIPNRPDFETVAKCLPEQGGLGCCGARGAKGRGQGECGSAKHGPDAEPCHRRRPAYEKPSPETDSGRISGSSSPSKVGARCVSSARRDLCGGAQYERPYRDRPASGLNGTFPLIFARSRRRESTYSVEKLEFSH